MKRIFLWLTAALLSAACQSKTEHTHERHDHAAMIDAGSPVATLEGRVLAMHDSVMPSMSELMRLRKAVEQKVATAVGADKEKGQSVANQLRQADDAMMNWMHQYNGDTLKKLDEAKALDYLKAEQAKINAVRDQMQKSIADAKAYTGQ